MMQFLQHVLRRLHPSRVYIQYSGFYDVPLGMVASHHGKRYFFERSFNDELDDYEDFYRVYDISQVSLPEGEAVWGYLINFPQKLLGTVPVKKISFR